MRTTVRQAIRDAADFVGDLINSNLGLDQVIDIDDSFAFSPIYKRQNQNRVLFDQIETDDYLNEGELVYFDYVDLEGRPSERVGYVVNPSHHGKDGKVILIYDLDKDEPRWFRATAMSNIVWLRPLPA
jgi:hypothetical protein